MNGLILKQSEDARIFAESVLNTIREPLLVLDEHLRVVLANSAFYMRFRADRSEIENRRIYDLGNKQWDIPKLRELLQTIIPENEIFEDYQVEHTFPNIGHRIMMLNARKVHQEGDKRSLILMAIEDLTDQVNARRALEESEALQKSL